MMTLAGRPGPARHRVVRAGAADAEVLAQVIADAFAVLDVSQWLVADMGVRRMILPGYFALHVEHALAEGLVLTTPDRDAAALWLPVAATGPEEPPEEYRARLAAMTGPHLDRFLILDEAFDLHRPTGVPHEHLAILAVHPGRQRLGIGTALMNAHHAILDRNGTPAYLEASDPAKREIYLAHGYADFGKPIQLPDGPPMYPMMRRPKSHSASEHADRRPT
jgi:GNAT superfamily N-acetyltransferase